MVWNLGVIIDYILNRKPFFSSVEEIVNFNGNFVLILGYYRNKNS